ncbi:gliding motility-associated C-terminal domain-containing protein [Spirosoma pomorum]
MEKLYRRLWLVVLTLSLLMAVMPFAQATHIVGGELELQKLSSTGTYTHRINLNLYFDNINGDPRSDDVFAFVAFYRKRDNGYMGAIQVPRISTEWVQYSNPTCASRARVETRLIRYSTDISFGQAFNDPEGYYVSWERCCRNGTITNIVRPGEAGSVFYLEFPAPWSGSTAFNNSSPVFSVAKGDYICIGQPFTFDFSAKDPDGDSLAYQLVTPYNGFSSNTRTGQPDAPITDAGPYRPIQWISGISDANQIPGSIPLRVNARTGLLQVTADREGLFVFSVEVREFRRGKQIGLVRRDFQLNVIDCPRNDPPKLLLKADGAKSFYQEGTVLTIAEKDTNCLNLYLTDPNANQRIQVINMSGSLPSLTLTPGELLTKTTKDTLQTKFCFGRCVGDGRPVTLMVRVTDDGCPQGLSDTLTIRLNIIPSANNKPKASTNLVNNQGRTTVGASLSFTAFGVDTDNDNITLRAVGRGFTLVQAGMNFGNTVGIGKVSQPFTWKPTCAQATQSSYVVDFIVTDARCNRNLSDTVSVTLRADGLPSQPPSIRTTLSGPVVDLVVSPNDSSGRSAFDVLGNDPDRDTLLMTGVGRGFDMKALGMAFTNKTGRPMLQSAFTWKPTCALMNGQSEATFIVDFVVDDRSCQPKHTDTTSVTFRLRDPSVSAEITVPNVFTPNGDGINDYFGVKDLPDNVCAEQFRSIDISNRWGKIIFTSIDPKFRWYGTDTPVGTYYYLIRTDKRTFKGPVTLIR